MVLPLSNASVTLSLEAKLHLLHSYMNVRWITLPCDTQVKGPGGSSFTYELFNPPLRKGSASSGALCPQELWLILLREQGSDSLLLFPKAFHVHFSVFTQPQSPFAPQGWSQNKWEVLIYGHLKTGTSLIPFFPYFCT